MRVFCSREEVFVCIVVQGNVWSCTQNFRICGSSEINRFDVLRLVGYCNFQMLGLKIVVLWMFQFSVSCSCAVAGSGEVAGLGVVISVFLEFECRIWLR